MTKQSQDEMLRIAYALMGDARGEVELSNKRLFEGIEAWMLMYRELRLAQHEAEVKGIPDVALIIKLDGNA